MELIYSWIDKYRTYENVGLNFSNKFIVDYKRQENTIEITRNTDYVSLHENHITNINLVVGKNGAGKTNLLDMIGTRNDERNKNNEEWETRLKNGNKPKGFNRTSDIVSIKKSIYFYIYYLGKNNESEDIFCIEGNDIDSFRSLLVTDIDLEENYRREKYWFPFICKNTNRKLKVLYDLNHITEADNHDNYCRKRERDSLVIVSFRENLNAKNYNHYSMKPTDEQRICVPRRIALFNSRLLANKIEMLVYFMKRQKRTMFKDDNYVLEIEYNNYQSSEAADNGEDILQSYEKLSDEYSRNICRLLETYVYHYYMNVFEDENLKSEIRQKIKDIGIDEYKLNKYIDYYKQIVQLISLKYFNDDSKAHEYVINSFNEMCDTLVNINDIYFEGTTLRININQKSDVEKIIKFVSATVDKDTYAEINMGYIFENSAEFSIFTNFFSWQLYYMSDGEKAFLGFFSSLYEQISKLTPEKDNYILLLDEPEARMHPELARIFINYLIRFLSDISEEKKKFQIIISTHSPFILSDIQNGNIIYLEKDEEGHSKSLKREIQTFGANIHSLLKDSFFMNSTIGEFAKDEINKLIKALKPLPLDEKKGELQYRTEEEVVQLLNVHTIDEIDRLINIISEPIIKFKLREMYNTYTRNTNPDLYKKDIQNQIYNLQEKLKEFNKE